MIQRGKHALRNIRFHRLGAGTPRTAVFRTPGNKRWPEPLDDWRNSLLTPSLTRGRPRRVTPRPWCGGCILRWILIGPFSETRLNFDHQPQIVVILHSSVVDAVRVVVNPLPDFYRIQVG